MQLSIQNHTGLTNNLRMYLVAKPVLLAVPGCNIRLAGIENKLLLTTEVLKIVSQRGVVADVNHRSSCTSSTCAYVNAMTGFVFYRTLRISEQIA